MKQHANVPTHGGGNTHDLMTTHVHDLIIVSVSVVDRYLSDHVSILCSLKSAKPDCVAKNIGYHQLKAIDFDALCQDVEKSELSTREYCDLREIKIEVWQSYHKTASRGLRLAVSR